MGTQRVEQIAMANVSIPSWSDKNTGKREQWWGQWREGRDQYALSQPASPAWEAHPRCPWARPSTQGALPHSPSPGGRNFLKGFCTEMGQRKEEKALGSPPDHGCACAAHEYFSGHLFIPAPPSCWGHRPKVDKYSHWTINEASAPSQPPYPSHIH